MVATVLPECVVRVWTSRVRRPWPVRVIIAGPPGFPGGRWLTQPGRAARPVRVARTHAPASPWSLVCSGKLVRRMSPPGRASAMLGRRQAHRLPETRVFALLVVIRCAAVRTTAECLVTSAQLIWTAACQVEHG